MAIKPKTILAIDTSCDDTSIAVAAVNKNKTDILSSIVSSQVSLHQKYGGVYPSLAKREHQKNLVPALEETLKRADLLKTKKTNQAEAKEEKTRRKSQKLKQILRREPELGRNLINFIRQFEKPAINAIAVTIGPGLEPCLWAGINFAKALSYFWNIPLIPVNHIEAHILANFTDKSKQFLKKTLPAVCAVISGGHSQLILMKKIKKYAIIGETRDDAAGECFDKTARILGLPYPGGPAIAQQAGQAADWSRQKTKLNIKLPRPMLNSPNYDFSFSGLKTAALYDYKKRQKKTTSSKQYIAEMSKEIQQAIVDVVIKKTMRAAKNYKAKSIILGGGVCANKELVRQLKKAVDKINFAGQPKSAGINLYAPPPMMRTDNAAMVAAAASFYLKYLKLKSRLWPKLRAKANLRITS